MIETFKILFFVSIVVWLFPPIRQYRNKYFFFFLVLALADPLSILLRVTSTYYTDYSYFILVNYLLFLSIIERNTLNKYKTLWIVFSFIFISIFFFTFQSKLLLILLLFTNATIIFTFLKSYIIEFVNQKNNLFLLCLIFYQLTNISKILNLLLGFADATAFFIITTIFQIAFGLFFSIFRENNSKIVL